MTRARKTRARVSLSLSLSCTGRYDGDMRSVRDGLERVGLENLAKACAESGVDGFIIVDLPPEEAELEGVLKVCQDSGLGFCPLVAPTTTDARLSYLAEVPSASSRGNFLNLGVDLDFPPLATKRDALSVFSVVLRERRETHSLSLSLSLSLDDVPANVAIGLCEA